MEIIDEYDGREARIRCSCGEMFFIFGVNLVKDCSCGKQYIIKTKIKELKTTHNNNCTKYSLSRWEGDEYVICIDDKPIGNSTLNKRQGETILNWLISNRIKIEETKEDKG